MRELQELQERGLLLRWCIGCRRGDYYYIGADGGALGASEEGTTTMLVQMEERLRERGLVLHWCRWGRRLVYIYIYVNPSVVPE